MIEKDKIEKIVNVFITGTDMFLVSVRTSSSNRITVLTDTMKGITIDECASLHRYLEQHLDRNIEDFELLVSSPGVDMPFVVIEQYRKNEGKKVEVVDSDGMKYEGFLKNVTDGGFEIEASVRIKGKGRELKDISFNYDQVKSTKEVLVIK